MKINFNSTTPIYIQIADELQRNIFFDKYHPGDKLPSVRDLVWEFETTSETAQHVYRELEKRGLVFSKRAIGHFVVEDRDLVQSIREQKIKKVTKNFFTEMERLGATKKEIKKYLKEQK